jgi:ferric-dicitrate binding protein FerR (iron transport regulator)
MRPPAPKHREARVRAAVHQHWKTTTRKRTVRRRALIASLAGVAATLLLVIAAPPWRFVGQRFGFVGQPFRAATGPAREVAVVERIEGSESYRSSGDRQVRLASGVPIREGEEVTTDPRSRLALRFEDGPSLRLDAASRVRLLSASEVELSAGALYLDTESETGFRIRTPFAEVRDIGTQFEVRVMDHAVRVRVRSGLAELRRDGRSIVGRPGTEITLSPFRADSQPVATHGSPWEWTGVVAPPIEIEGVPLAHFLDRIVREHGWTLTYSDPGLAREAARIVLHGSVAGLDPSQTVQVAMLTSGFRHRLANGALVVMRGDDAR